MDRLTIIQRVTAIDWLRWAVASMLLGTLWVALVFISAMSALFVAISWGTLSLDPDAARGNPFIDALAIVLFVVLALLATFICWKQRKRLVGWLLPLPQA